MCFVSSPAGAFEWRSFTPDEGGFRLDLPALPSVEEIRKGVPMFTFRSTAYRADVGPDGFGVNHTDLPRTVALLVPRGRILEATRRGLIEEASAVEVAFRKIRFAGREARELIYDRPAQGDKPPLRGIARIFFQGSRLYIFWVEASQGLPAAVRERFFASVRVDDD